MRWILAVFAIQCLVACLIIFVLKYLLDRELIEAAMEKIQASVKLGGGPIIVVSASVLEDDLRNRIRSIVRKKAPDDTIEFKEDPKLKGGVVIYYSDEEMDFSLVSRLKGMWS